MRPEDIVVDNKSTPKKEPVKTPGKEVKPAKDAPKVETKEEKPKKKLNASLPHTLKKVSGTIGRYQAPAIAIIVVILLAVTALRMLHYANPLSDDARTKEDLNKFKKVQIDSKTVDRIKQLQEAPVTTGTSVESNRTNPFEEQ